MAWHRGTTGTAVLWALRVSLPAIAFAMTLTAIEEGVDFSDRPGMPSAGLAEQVYYASGLFFMGGLDLGVPVGGPTWARIMMWVAYFFAPLVTVSALIEGAVRTVNPALLSNPMRNHILVVGDSGVAERVLTRICASSSRSIISVAAPSDRLPADLNVRRISADIRNDRTLDSLKLGRARRVLLLTDDDFTNLDVATRILQRAPHLAGQTIVHLKDARMERVTESLGALEGAVVFNTHATAARHLVNSELMQHFHHTEPRDVVVLAGFGRFGQALLRELISAVPEAFEKLILVDLNASQTVRVFEEDTVLPDIHRVVIDGDLRDPGVWTRIDAETEGHEEPVFVLGSGDDGTNVRSAMQLANSHPRALVIARTFVRSAFAEHAAKQSGFSLVSIAELLESSTPSAWAD